MAAAVRHWANAGESSSGWRGAREHREVRLDSMFRKCGRRDAASGQVRSTEAEQRDDVRSPCRKLRRPREPELTAERWGSMSIWSAAPWSGPAPTTPSPEGIGAVKLRYAKEILSIMLCNI